MLDMGEEIIDKGVRIGQLEGQVKTLETIVGEHEAICSLASSSEKWQSFFQL